MEVLFSVVELLDVALQDLFDLLVEYLVVDTQVEVPVVVEVLRISHESFVHDDVLFENVEHVDIGELEFVFLLARVGIDVFDTHDVLLHLDTIQETHVLHVILLQLLLFVTGLTDDQFLEVLAYH